MEHAGGLMELGDSEVVSDLIVLEK